MIISGIENTYQCHRTSGSKVCNTDFLPGEICHRNPPTIRQYCRPNLPFKNVGSPQSGNSTNIQRNHFNQSRSMSPEITKIQAIGN